MTLKKPEKVTRRSAAATLFHKCLGEDKGTRRQRDEQQSLRLSRKRLPSPYRSLDSAILSETEDPLDNLHVGRSRTDQQGPLCAPKVDPKAFRLELPILELPSQSSPGDGIAGVDKQPGRSPDFPVFQRLYPVIGLDRLATEVQDLLTGW